MFSNTDYKKYSKFLLDELGIHIGDSKKKLLRHKVDKIMLTKNIASYEDYFSIVSKSSIKNKEDFQDFIDSMTTNTTEFFRGQYHFDYIEKNIDEFIASSPQIRKTNEIRIWSAGCSTGQEPISLSILFNKLLHMDHLIGIELKILATDINKKVLLKAMKGIYSEKECQGIPPLIFNRYFSKLNNGALVDTEILSNITYRQFNLIDNFPFKKKFDFIFCRNVMIYFDKDTQQNLLDKFHNQLSSEGLLFVGHSESLIDKTRKFKYLAPSVYKKI